MPTQKRWIILITLLILSIEPVSAVEMGIAMDTQPTSFNGDALEYNPLKDYTTVQEDSIEYRKLLQDAPSRDAVETPSLQINPSHNDVEGYYPESHTDYEKELDASKPLTIGVVTAIVVITLTLILIYSGGGAAPDLPPLIGRLADLGHPEAPAVDAGVPKFVFTEQELLEGITIITGLNMGAGAVMGYGPAVIQKITEFLDRVGTDHLQTSIFVHNLDNTLTILQSPLLSIKARTQLFLGMTLDQQTQVLQTLPLQNQLDLFLEQLADTLTIIDLITSIHTLLNLVNQFHGDYAAQILTRMVDHGNGDYAGTLLTEMVDRGYEQPLLKILKQMIRQGYMKQLAVIFNSAKTQQAVKLQTQLFLTLTLNQQVQLIRSIPVQGHVSVVMQPSLRVNTLHNFREQLAKTFSLINPLITIRLFLRLNQVHDRYSFLGIKLMVKHGYFPQTAIIIAEMVNQGFIHDATVFIMSISSRKLCCHAGMLFTAMVNAGYIHQAQQVMTQIANDSISHYNLADTVLTMDQAIIDKLSEGSTWLLELFIKSLNHNGAFVYAYFWILAHNKAIKKIETLIKSIYQNNPRTILWWISQYTTPYKKPGESSELRVLVSVLVQIAKKGGLDLVSWIMMKGARLQPKFTARVLKSIFKHGYGTAIEIMECMVNLGYEGDAQKLWGLLNDFWRQKIYKLRK